MAGSTNGTLELRAGLVPRHPIGAVVTQSLKVGQAYPLHTSAPWAGEAIFSPAQIGHTQVKRVVGMTRTSDITDELDGSKINCTFTGGAVGGAVKQFGEVVGPNGNGHSWIASDVNQGGPGDVILTGFDAVADSNIVNAWDSQYSWVMDTTAASKTVVEFPSLNVTNLLGRSVTSGGALEGGNSRYTHETVNVNLKTATRPMARDLSQLPLP